MGISRHRSLSLLLIFSASLPSPKVNGERLSLSQISVFSGLQPPGYLSTQAFSKKNEMYYTALTDFKRHTCYLYDCPLALKKICKSSSIPSFLALIVYCFFFLLIVVFTPAIPKAQHDCSYNSCTRECNIKAEALLVLCLYLVMGI